jgi:hypothetical protein
MTINQGNELNQEGPTMATKAFIESLFDGSVPIDANMVTLLRTINGLKGIRTNLSCGGHANSETGLVLEGEWVIDFSVDPTCLAWESLAIVAAAAASVQTHEDSVRLTAWHDDDSLQFELHATGVDPDDFAEAIDYARENL